jgi:UDP-N-acetylglucosamine 2-epimerase (non-hydrolysing)
MAMIKVLSIFGTRPEAIKMAPIVRALEKDARFSSRLCVTHQHSDLLDQMLSLFELVPDHDLAVMREGQGLTHITTAVLQGLDPVLDGERPDWVLVHGDTTTTFAATLAAFYAGVPVGHVEAGLRTQNLSSPWPEEANRQIVGRLASLHFAPTQAARDNLLLENIDAERILITGNTVVDALYVMREKLADDCALRQTTTDAFSFLDPQKKLILVTGHRRENLGTALSSLCDGLEQIAARNDVEIYFAVHPNPQVRSIVERKLAGVPNIFLGAPLAYPALLWALERAALVITDSGGIQEEAPSFGTPVLVTRDQTERREALLSGAVRLVGTDALRLVSAAHDALAQPAHTADSGLMRNPYGDGLAARRILDALAEHSASPSTDKSFAFDFTSFG